MFSAQCPDCYKEYSRKDAMLRHFKQKHNSSNRILPEGVPPTQGTSPPPPQGVPPPPPPQGVPPPPPPPQEENMVFQHPFTMLVSGPTACGKTTFVQTLLQDQGQSISPAMQRIVWLYKRWQPLYNVIRRTVMPAVEFIQGIPQDLDDDGYFDSRINNLLVLDDIFSTAGKDQRITDLFTEGSHHRSLSVISINQNLFGNKDPTQRRNCHYLVLFNNPVDKQSVMVLGRQMYPDRSNYFMKHFAKATKHPYGYLMIDLKPFTPESKRLKCSSAIKILTNQNAEPGTETIKEGQVPTSHHSAVGTQTNHIVEQDKTPDYFENTSEPIMDNTGQACDDCGQLFDTVHDVQRHVKSGWCPENREQKKRKHEEENDSEQDETVENNEAYIQLWKRARNSNKEKFEKIYNTYIDDGKESDEAQEMAEERTQPHNEKAFFNDYTILIDNYILPLKNNGIHRQIMNQIDKLISKGYSTTSAVKRTLRKYKNSFQDVFDMEFTDDESDVEINASEGESDAENE